MNLVVNYKNTGWKDECTYSRLTNKGRLVISFLENENHPGFTVKRIYNEKQGSTTFEVYFEDKQVSPTDVQITDFETALKYITK